MNNIRKINNYTWIELILDPDLKNEKELTEQLEYLQLDEMVIEGILADQVRGRISKLQDGMLIILRDLNLNKDEEDEMISIRLFIKGNLIITVSKNSNVASLNHAKSLWEINQIEDFETIPDFVCFLIEKMNENISEYLLLKENKMDLIEEKLSNLENLNPLDYEKVKKEIEDEILFIKSQLLNIRRYLSPQKEVIMKLLSHKLNSNVSFVEHKDYISELYHDLIRIIENLDRNKEQILILKEDLTNITNNKLNKNLYILAIISSIFMPLTFLTGLFGINVEGIPLAHHSYGFYIFFGILVFIFKLQYLIFKKNKWI